MRAGKTTLMDVLACRKTVGRCTGDVRVNGFPQHPETFARITGYVEQEDASHSPQVSWQSAPATACLPLPCSSSCLALSIQTASRGCQVAASLLQAFAVCMSHTAGGGLLACLLSCSPLHFIPMELEPSAWCLVAVVR